MFISDMISSASH